MTKLFSLTFKCLFSLLMASHVCVVALPDDAQQAIKIEADSAKRMEKVGIMQYLGNVVLQQGSLIVKADSININNNADGEITHIIATGKPVEFEQQPQIDQEKIIAQAAQVNYWITEGKVSLTGQAKLQQGASSLNSDTIVYLIKEQVFTAEKEDSESNSTSSRVQMVIPAPSKQTKTDSSKTE